MKVGAPQTAELTYCLNVHPGESWAENLNTIRGDALAVRERVAPAQPFGLGLRLSAQAAGELMDASRLLELQNTLTDNELYVFTVNGFPYGAFHGVPVKQDVYRPDWREPERVTYTRQLGSIMSQLVPEGVAGSISTVPGSYGAWIRDAEDVSAMARHLADTALEFAHLEDQTGRQLVLALEPEPDCYLETTAQAISFFKQVIWREGAGHLVSSAGLKRNPAEELLHRHLGLCFDTCHLSLQFEDLAASLRDLVSTGVRIGKIQVSAALQTAGAPDTRDVLGDFDDPVYLHQVRVRDARGQVTAFGDLPDALSNAGNEIGLNQCEWRVHCHVPLTFEHYGSVGSTVGDLDETFFREALKGEVHQFENETYTFGVLPEAVQAAGLIETLAGELKWTRDMLAAAAPLSGPLKA